MASKSDIWERLGEHVTYSYMPQSCRVAMDDARKEIARLRDDAIEASVRIADLEGQLAARDAQIATWLRGVAAKVIGVISTSKGYDTAKAEGYADIIEVAADKIERGDYRPDHSARAWQGNEAQSN